MANQDSSTEKQNSPKRSEHVRTSQVQPNPSRNNSNTNKGQGYGKSFEAQSGDKRDAEIDPTRFDRDEISLDRSRVSNSQNNETNELSPEPGESENNDQGLQAGSGADYGSGAVHGTSRQSESSSLDQRSNDQLNRNQDDSKLQ
jgi:hypothetical protein